MNKCLKKVAASNNTYFLKYRYLTQFDRSSIQIQIFVAVGYSLLIYFTQKADIWIFLMFRIW